jgi:hypothetical protein
MFDLLACLVVVIEDFVIFLNNAYIFPVVVLVNSVLVVIVVVRDVCRREPTGTYEIGLVERSVHVVAIFCLGWEAILSLTLGLFSMC